MAACIDDRTSSYYVGDVGTVITVNTCVDISDGTLFKLKYKKQSGTTGEWIGTRDGTSIRYTIVSGDWDEAGEYRIQAYVVTPIGSWHGDVTRFVVKDYFE